MLYAIVFLIHKHNQYLTGIQLRLETKVGEGLRFQHFSCIVINEATIIGKNCLIFQGVTIGVGTSGIPRIGNNVTIGANAVVTKDVPDNSIAVGIPAKVIAVNTPEKQKLYYCH